MAGTWTESDWHKEKLRIARDAAKSYVGKRNFTGKSQRFIDAVEKEKFRQAVDELDERYPFDKLKDTEKDAVSNLKGEDAAKFLGLTGGNEAFRNSYDPLLKKKMDDFSKLGPLVLGLADEGRDWYSMGAEDLFAKGKELGYDTSTKKGKMDFLRDVGDVQQAHERGKMLEEFNKGTSVWYDIAYPTLMEEARKQITTGRGTQEQLDDARKLDIIMNAGIGVGGPMLGDAGKAFSGVKAAAEASKFKPLQTLAKSPVFKPAALEKYPVVSGMIAPAYQGAAEAEGQIYKERKIDPELEADYTNALLALATGATRPGMIGTAAAFAQQFPGRVASRFSRGIAGATRRGNPVNIEREELGDAFDIYAKLFRGVKKKATNEEETAAKNLKEASDELAKLGGAKTAEEQAKRLAAEEQVKNLINNHGVPVKLSDLEKGNVADKFTDKVMALYYGDADKANEMLAKGTKEQMLADYDDIAKMFVHRDPNNYYKKVMDGYELVNGNKLKSGNYLAALEQAFPSKMAEAYGNDGVYRAGLRTGQILGTLGGSLEPMFKVNPMGMFGFGGRVNMVDTDYKKTPWYKSLSKKQQEAFDDAYEKSKKESE
jgi:hypothetical protein